MSPIKDHALRYKLANELHARPFPAQGAPSHVAYLAIKRPHDAASRDRISDRAHLVALLDRYGAPHPQPDATHYSGKIGRYDLKWESHTEFVTYTIFADGVEDRPFDPVSFQIFPQEWLAEAPGVRITSALFRVVRRPTDDVICTNLNDWFVPESLAVCHVLDRSAIIAGDFRIDESGHIRFAIFADEAAGPQRIGRIVQRLCEIETYKAMSMLGYERARELGHRTGEIDQSLLQIVEDMTSDTARPEETLEVLLPLSAELEKLVAQSAFRFGATGAYEAIVNQRISVLREERFNGLQTFSEFMMRRYDPAMRTVKAAERQLKAMAKRAMRAGELLRTRVDVERSAQNQALLESMDRRADQQLHLQQTVEGLSVVAISYYAVNLATYLGYPLAGPLGLSKAMLTAVLTPPVLLAVWWMVRQIRKGIG